MRRAYAGPALSLVLVAVATAGCLHDEGGVLAVGEVAATGVRAEGQTFEVRVPSGAITVVVGDPVDEANTDQGVVRPPDGGSLIPVSWSLDRALTNGVTGFDQESELIVLTSDGETPAATISDGAAPADSGAVVAVDGSGDVEGLDVEYDGVVQRFAADGDREPGVADELYSPQADGERVDCDDDWRLEGTAVAGATAEVDCTVRAWTLPYLPEAGWAEESRVHAVLEPNLMLAKVTDGGEEYRATFSDATTKVNGVEITPGLEVGAPQAGSVGGRLVVPSASAPLEWQAEIRFTLRARHSGGPLDGSRVALAGGLALGG